VKTEIVEWLGRVDGRKRRGVTDFLNDVADAVKDAVRSPAYELTAAQEIEHLEKTAAEYAEQERVNDLLTAETISLESITEIADMQADTTSDAKESPAGESGEVAAGAGGNEGAQ
jgi:hypothetical protein